MIRRLNAADAGQALILYNELTLGPQANNPAVFDIVIAHAGTSVWGAFVGFSNHEKHAIVLRR
ncbi:MAG: hypothetical protein WBG95_02010 [Sulfitobacter sp.]